MPLSPTTSHPSAGAAAALVKLDEQTLAADGPSLTFAAIDGSYSHLKIVLRARSTRATANDTARLQFNADTATNYYSQTLYGLGATATSAEFLIVASGLAGYCTAASDAAGLFALSEVTIAYYAATTQSKAWFSDGIDPEALTTGTIRRFIAGGVWNSTAAIAQVLMFPLTGPNFLAGTRATLYGIT